MKKLLIITDSTANKISYYHVMLLLLSLPYDMFYSHLILISLAVHTIINFKKTAVKPIFTSTNLLLQAVFFLTLLGTIYTANKPQAFTEWGRHLTIFLIPLIFCINPLDLKKYRNNLLLVFSSGCTVSILYLYVQALITIKYYQFPVTALFSSAFTNHNFAEPFDIHATFFSMQIAIALVYLLIKFVKEGSRWSKICYLLCCCILAAGIIQLSSKSVFVALLLIINIAIPHYFLIGVKRLKFISISVCLSLMLMAGIYKMESFKERYITDLKKDLSSGSSNDLTDPRWARWGVAMNLAVQSPVIGHGSGSEVGLLKDRFFDHQFYRSFLVGLNAHNQFISFFIKWGIIGLAVYLVILFWGFKTAVTRHDLLLLAFMVIITSVSMSENFLDVDKGIFFYAVFFSLFMYSAQSKKEVTAPANTA